MTEKEKMEHGLWYDANFDPELLKERAQADALCFELNQTSPLNEKKRNEILQSLLGKIGKGVTILSPFYTDYGVRSFVGDGCFFNHNVYLMDGGTITFGDNCFIGPGCGFYTANHPLVAQERNAGLEIAKEIIIGNNVWFGADCSILPGVHIGNNTVIGAKSLVTKDIPDNCLAMGNPCRVIRTISEKDRISPFAYSQDV